MCVHVLQKRSKLPTFILVTGLIFRSELKHFKHSMWSNFQIKLLIVKHISAQRLQIWSRYFRLAYKH